MVKGYLNLNNTNVETYYKGVKKVLKGAALLELTGAVDLTKLIIDIEEHRRKNDTIEISGKGQNIDSDSGNEDRMVIKAKDILSVELKFE